MEDWILIRLEEIKTRFKELEIMMTKPEIISNQALMKKISKEYRNLENINELWGAHNKISSEIKDNEEMINSDDEEFSDLAKSENDILEQKLQKIFK